MSDAKQRPTCGTCPFAHTGDGEPSNSMTCEIDPPVPVTVAVIQHQHGGRVENQIQWTQPKVTPTHSCSRHPERQADTSRDTE